MSAFYDSYDYKSYWTTRQFEDKSEKIALLSFLKKINKKDSIIDIGGGFGRLSSVYCSLFKKCVLVDPSADLLELAKEENHFSNLFFLKANLPDLSIKEKFDVALMIRVSHHLLNPLPSFKEVYELLNTDGYFILEIANKIHLLARLKAYLKGDFNFVNDYSSMERRSMESIKKGKITFVNHHPKKIINELKEIGFCLENVLSVSNFRNSILKKIIPQKILLLFEEKLQSPLGKIYFGPSIFILLRKCNK